MLFVRIINIYHIYMCFYVCDLSQYFKLVSSLDVDDNDKFKEGLLKMNENVLYATFAAGMLSSVVECNTSWINKEAGWKKKALSKTSINVATSLLAASPLDFEC